MKNGVRVFFTVLLWILFLGVLGMIVYLSFQNGEDAKALGKDYIQVLAERYYETEDIPAEVMTEFTYKLRQLGRIGIFFALGILGTSCIHASFYRINWILRTIISLVMLLAVAVFTEKYKVYLPTRHFSEDEMILSIAGAVFGFVIISIITLVMSIVKLIKKASGR